MRKLGSEFDLQCQQLLRLTDGLEEARVLLWNRLQRRDLMTIFRLELTYELTFLRMFSAWEELVEEAFMRHLCGHSFNGQTELAVAQQHQPSLASARSTVYNGRDYLLWHNPAQALGRFATHLNNSRIEAVFRSARSILEDFAAIRHRIAHDQKDAQMKFDNATLRFAGRRYRAARPGRFLRDWTQSHNNSQVRWIQHIADDLINLALQFAP